MFAASQGRFPEAARYYHQSLRTLIDAADVVWLYKPVAGLAAVAVENGDAESAARLLGAVDMMLLSTGVCTSRPTLPLALPWGRSGSPPSIPPVDVWRSQTW